MRDLAVLAISIGTAVAVAVALGMDDGALTAAIALGASLLFWGRLFARDRSLRLWMLLLTFVISLLPVVMRVEAVKFLSAIVGFVGLTIGEVSLMRDGPLDGTSWMPSAGALWNPELYRRNRDLLDNYERSKGALLFDQEPEPRLR